MTLRLDGTRRFRAFALAATATFGAFGGGWVGCAGEPRVVRVYDGRIVTGGYVSPEAYAAFMRGALAEEALDLKSALTSYAVAAGEDEDDPEISARIGSVRCALDPKDVAADRSFDRALRNDASYASAVAAKGRCMTARGRIDEGAELARRAAAQDPSNVGLAAQVVTAEAARPDPSVREKALALTAAHAGHPAAWDALVAWGRAHRDADLVARGLSGLVRAAPTRSLEVERGAIAMLDGGQLVLARTIAAAVVDSPRDLGVVGPRDQAVARLAVDEALARGDRDKALARATRGHVPLAEVAARALLVDQRELAGAFAGMVIAADPASSGARMVKAALEAAPTALPAAVQGAGAPPSTGRDVSVSLVELPPEICTLVFADRLAMMAGTEAARAWLAKVERMPMALNDPLAGPLAVDLATRGVVAVESLPERLRTSLRHVRAPE